MPTTLPPRVRACLFDMDGLLLNTEDLITAAINTLLSAHHLPPLAWSLKAHLQGLSAASSTALLLTHTHLPLTPEEYTQQLALIHERIFPTARPLPGVENLLNNLHSAHPEIELGLATSSSREKFLLKTASCRALFEFFFPEDCRVLGDDPRVQNHKPAPDIYLCALKCVNERRTRRRLEEGETPPAPDAPPAPLAPAECLVLEDALPGVDAGRQAGMQVVWCPHAGLVEEILEGEGEGVRESVERVFGLGKGIVGKGLLGFDGLKGVIERETGGWVRVVGGMEEVDMGRYCR